jgi:hypothetical protein
MTLNTIAKGINKSLQLFQILFGGEEGEQQDIKPVYTNSWV